MMACQPHGVGNILRRAGVGYADHQAVGPQVRRYDDLRVTIAVRCRIKASFHEQMRRFVADRGRPAASRQHDLARRPDHRKAPVKTIGIKVRLCRVDRRGQQTRQLCAGHDKRVFRVKFGRNVDDTRSAHRTLCHRQFQV